MSEGKGLRGGWILTFENCYPPTWFVRGGGSTLGPQELYAWLRPCSQRVIWSAITHEISIGLFSGRSIKSSFWVSFNLLIEMSEWKRFRISSTEFFHEAWKVWYIVMCICLHHICIHTCTQCFNVSVRVHPPWPMLAKTCGKRSERFPTWFVDILTNVSSVLTIGLVQLYMVILAVWSHQK